MKRVLLLWTAPTSTNLGVRALGEGSAALVRRVAPDAEIVSQSYGRGEAPVNIGVGRSLARELLLDSRGLRSWLRGFDCVIDTRAGDSFADIYGIPRLRQICQMAEFVKACGVPLVLGPQTVGPFTSRRGKFLGTISLRRANMVMVRDSASYQTSARLGRSPDVLTTDVVFAMEQPESENSRDVLLNVSGLLWASDDHGPAAEYQNTIRRLICGLQDRHREVTLLSHVLDSVLLDNDEPTARQLSEEFGLEHVVPTDLTHLRSIVMGANLVVGSRMHACLNALSVGTPTIPLAYSRKFRPLLADLGWRNVVDLHETQRPAADLFEMLDSGPNLGDQVADVRSRADDLLDDAENALGAYL